MAVDRRAFIEGAIASMFTGMLFSGKATAALVPVDVNISILPGPSSPKNYHIAEWREIFEACLKQAAEVFEIEGPEFPGYLHEFCVAMADAIWGASKNRELALTSFEISTAPCWLPPTTITVSTDDD